MLVSLFTTCAAVLMAKSTKKMLVSLFTTCAAVLMAKSTNSGKHVYIEMFKKAGRHLNSRIGNV